MASINPGSVASATDTRSAQQSPSTASSAVVEIFYNTFYIGTTIAIAFAGPFSPVLQGVQLMGSCAYYAVIIPNFVQNCIQQLRQFMKGEGPKIPLKTQLNNALQPFNIFGPQKLEAIKNIAILAFKALSWALFIGSFFVMPHMAFCFCLTASAMALSMGIKDLYVHFMNKKNPELPQLGACVA